jgi:hypothetical protein
MGSQLVFPLAQPSRCRPDCGGQLALAYRIPTAVHTGRPGTYTFLPDSYLCAARDSNPEPAD